MDRRLVFSLLIIGILLSVSVYPVSAGWDFSPIDSKLSGTRINFVPPGSGLEFREDEKSYIIHGWHMVWTTAPGAWKQAFVRTACFKVLIDGEQITFQRFQWYMEEIDEMFILYYIQFEAYHFKPGVYEFKGTWSAVFEGEYWEISLTYMVTVTSA